MWDLDGFVVGAPGFTAEPEVAVAYPQSGRTRVPRLHNVKPGTVVVVDGIRVTRIERLVLDLGTLRDPDLLERAAECALRRGMIDELTLRRLAAARAMRGVPTLRTVMGRRPVGAPATGSDLETLTVQLFRRGCLPTPDRQVRPLPGSAWRMDLAWPMWMVAVEVDGLASHGPAEFSADRRRQNRIVLGGWVLLRFTWGDVTDSPEYVLATVREALRRQGCRI